MSLKLKLDIRFGEPLLFRGFLPEAETDRLRFRLQDGREIALYLSDRRTQLLPFDVAPSDPQRLKEHGGTINCIGLTMELVIPEPYPDVMRALAANQPAESVNKLLVEARDLALRVHNGLVEYVRNVEKQYWLQPIVPETYAHIRFLVGTEVYWLDESGEWREFPKFPTNHTSICPWEMGISGPDVTLDQDIAISQDKWQSRIPVFLQRFIDEGKRASTIDTLIANAYWHLERLETSLAIVEAVRALEQFVRSQLPKVVRNYLMRDKQVALGEEDISKLFQKAGLRAVTLLVLELLGQSLGVEPKDIEQIQHAVNLRNEVLHLGRERVSFPEANECIASIHRAISILGKTI